MTLRRIILLSLVLLFLINSEAFAKSEEATDKNADVKKNFEIQLEYFNGKIFNNRNVNNYNVHVFQQFKQRRALSLHRGITFTRATGYSKPDEDFLDSEGVGVGPAFMLRWKKQSQVNFMLLLTLLEVSCSIIRHIPHKVELMASCGD